MNYGERNINKKRGILALGCLTAFTALSFTWPTLSPSLSKITSSEPKLKKAELRNSISLQLSEQKKLPSFVAMPSLGGTKQYKVEYTLQPELQDSVEKMIRLYHPDHAAFVAIDASTGKIISWVGYSKREGFNPDLALRASFPSASVFKVVTAAAAISQRKLHANSVIPFNGRNHTLYRSQIMKDHVTKWTRTMTVKEAFAKSVNTVFGKIGANTVGAVELRDYAERFGFNQNIDFDLPVQPGTAHIPDDVWGLAETASGFTKETTMSPLQGAMIGSVIVNRGVMMEPYAVENLIDERGESIYKGTPRVLRVSTDAATANELHELMRETVIHGTSQKSFRGFGKSIYQSITVGGKTGSLTGNNPKGKYDWFVGFAENQNRKIAFAALTINEKWWTVKSAFLARKAVENYFATDVAHLKKPTRHRGRAVALQ